MLGMAKGSLGGNYTPPPANISVSITPSSFVDLSSNGSYTTPFFTAIPSNGVGPFAYSWSFEDGTVMTPNNKKTRLSISGYNRQVVSVLRLTVTDTGDGNKTATAEAIVDISFEGGFK